MKQFKRKPTDDKKNTVKFQDLAKAINHYLNEDKVVLTFQGYRETLLKYFRLADNNLLDSFELMTECNLWSNYVIDVEGIVQAKYLSLILEIDSLKALIDKQRLNEDLEKQIAVLIKKSKDFNLFLKLLNGQKRFFERAFYHCVKVYSRGINTLRYKNLD